MELFKLIQSSRCFVLLFQVILKGKKIQILLRTVSVLSSTHRFLTLLLLVSCWPPPAVPSLTPAPDSLWLSACRALFCCHAVIAASVACELWVWAICSSAGVTAEHLSALSKCHPLLSVLQPWPFFVSCGLCHSTRTQKEIWHLWVCVHVCACFPLILFPTRNLEEGLWRFHFSQMNFRKTNEILNHMIIKDEG